MDSKDNNRRTGQKTGRKPSTASRSNTATKVSRGSKARKTASRKTAGRQRAREQQSRPTPDVVYVQPGPFNKGRFFLRLATV